MDEQEDMDSGKQTALDLMQAAMHEPMDVREVLKPYLGKEVRVGGLIEKNSMTKGKYKKPSSLLVDVKVFVEGEILDLEYVWLVSDIFEEGQQYIFTANVIEYTTYDAERNASTKYGLGSFRRLVKHKGDVDAAMRVADNKEGIADKARAGQASTGVAVIQEVLDVYGLVITPTVVVGGKWECAILRPGSNEKISISIEASFVSAAIKARDIVAFLCEPVQEKAVMCT